MLRGKFSVLLLAIATGHWALATQDDQELPSNNGNGNNDIDPRLQRQIQAMFELTKASLESKIESIKGDLEQISRRISKMESKMQANAEFADKDLIATSAAVSDGLMATSNQIILLEESLEHKIGKVNESSGKTSEQLLQTGKEVNSSINELRKIVEMIRCRVSPVKFADYHRQMGQAAVSGNVTAVRQLLDVGCLDVSWRDENEYNPCSWKVKNGTVLHRATQCDRNTTAEIVRMLIEAGADVNMEEGGYGSASLHAAARYGNAEIVRLLLDKGADINLKNNNGWTALMHAAYYGQEEVAGLLLEKGAEINVQSVENFPGWTALMMAAEKGYVGIAEKLLAKGAEINLKREDGSTALMVAAVFNTPEVAGLLLRSGADRTGYEAERIKSCPSCPE